MPGTTHCTCAPPVRPGRSLRRLHPRLMLRDEARVRRALVRNSFLLLLAVLAALAAGCGGTTRDPGRRPATQRRDPPKPKQRPTPPAGPFDHPLSAPHLVPGSDPSALPADVLIADRSNNRLLVVDPRGRIVWRFPAAGGRSLPLPDDAFFSPDGRRIVVTEEDVDAVSIVDRRFPPNRLALRRDRRPRQQREPARPPRRRDPASRRIGLHRRHRELPAPPAPPAVAPAGARRRQPGARLRPRPAARLGSPNGAFPLQRGGTLVTEINGSWVDALSPGGRLLWSTHRRAFPIRPTRTRFGRVCTSPSAGRARGSSRRSTGTAVCTGATGRVPAHRRSTIPHLRSRSPTGTSWSTTTPTTA